MDIVDVLLMLWSITTGHNGPLWSVHIGFIVSLVCIPSLLCRKQLLAHICCSVGMVTLSPGKSSSVSGEVNNRQSIIRSRNSSRIL